MGTRAGDVDAGLFSFLEAQGLTIDEIDDIINKKSGLLGLSGVSNDFRAVSNSTEPDAVLAREVFVERIRKYLGSYIVKLKGDVDGIVFTGGIGENDASLRADVLEGLESMGIAVDQTKNAAGVVDVAALVSKTKVLVIPTNEELSISLQAVEASCILPQPSDATTPVTKKASSNKANTNASCRSLFAHGMERCYVADEEISLLQRFACRLERVGYFRCIARDNPHGEDYKITLMKEHFHLECDPSTMYGVTANEAMDMLAHGQDDALYEKILTKYLAYTADKDFVLVSNSNFGSDSLNFASQMAQALGAPAVLIGDRGDEGELAVVGEEFKKASVDVTGAIISGIDELDVQIVKEELEGVGLNPVALLPYEEKLYKKTVGECVRLLSGAKVLHGNAGEGVVKRIKVFTQQVADFMDHLDKEEGTLILTHVSRVDAIMAMLLAMQSVNVPGKLAGIVLTGYDEDKMNPQLSYILNGLDHVNVPVIATKDDTWTTASTIKEAPVFLTSDSIEKISLSSALFDQHLDEDFVNR